MDNEIIAAKKLVEMAQNVTVITGAGVSTDSGIPDFRGPNGIWTRDPDAEKVTDLLHYKTSPKIRAKTWDRYLSDDWDNYEPNLGHKAIAKLHEDDKLLLCITQNIDGLHIKSGLPEERVAELHGNLRSAVCLGCGYETNIKQCREDCPDCGGLVKPNVVFFGEQLNPSLFHKAEMASISCDVMLVVGTTLLVWPVADLPKSAKMSDIPVVYVNGSPPPASAYTDVNLIGSISEILPQIV